MTDHTNITSPSLTSDTVLFFDVPLEFFQTTDDFKVLLARLQAAQEVFPDSEIEASLSFKTNLEEIRTAWKQFAASEAERLAERQLEQEKEQVAIAVLNQRASYFDLLPADQDRVFDFVTEIAFTQGHEHQQKAGLFLARVQREATRISQNNQRELIAATKENAQANEALLEAAQRQEEALGSLQDSAFMSKVEMLVQRRISANLSVILAEAEEAFHAPHNNVEKKGFFGNTQVIGKLRSREYFVAVVKNQYEVRFRTEIENELLGRVPQTEAFFSSIANDETSMLESIAPRIQYPPTVSRFAQ